MARRRVEKEEKPDLAFEVPEFDEAEFIRKETISFRTTLILFIYSIVTAFITFVAWATLVQNWWFALLIGLGLGVALRWMYPALKVDISHWKRKEWVGTGLLYFFSWLAFIIFFVNPPLYDGVPPEVNIYVSPAVQEPGGPVNITLLGLDNVHVDEGSLRFEMRDPGGRVIAENADLVPGAHEASWSLRRTIDTQQEGDYTIRVTLSDLGGGVIQRSPQTTTAERTFSVQADALQVFLTGAGADRSTARFGSPDDTVRVQIPAEIDVYRAYLALDDGTEILLAHDPETEVEDRTVWRARADFDGWQEGNNTFHVHVQDHNVYWIEGRYGLSSHTSSLVSSDAYTVIIDDPGILGDSEATPPVPREVAPVQIPGPGGALLLGGIVAAVFLARRRQQ